jgi:hypothetical protein
MQIHKTSSSALQQQMSIFNMNWGPKNQSITFSQEKLSFHIINKNTFTSAATSRNSHESRPLLKVLLEDASDPEWGL